MVTTWGWNAKILIEKLTILCLDFFLFNGCRMGGNRNAEHLDKGLLVRLCGTLASQLVNVVFELVVVCTTWSLILILIYLSTVDRYRFLFIATRIYVPVAHEWHYWQWVWITTVNILSNNTDKNSRYMIFE